MDLKSPGAHVLAFQEAPGHVPPQWPARRLAAVPPGPRRWTTEEMEAAEKKVLALGATALDLDDAATARLPRVRRPGRPPLLPLRLLGDPEKSGPVPSGSPVPPVPRSRPGAPSAPWTAPGGPRGPCREVRAAQDALDVAPGEQRQLRLGPAAFDELGDQLRITRRVGQLVGRAPRGVVRPREADALRPGDPRARGPGGPPPRAPRAPCGPRTAAPGTAPWRRPPPPAARR